MSKCPICGKAVEKMGDEAHFLFRSAKTGKDAFCCDQCEQQIQVIKSSNEPMAVRDALDYFNAYLEEAEDSQTRDFLCEVFKSNTTVVIDSSAKKNTDSNSTGWITGLRFLAWVSFFGITIGGIVAATSLHLNSGLGFLVILLSAVVAFVIVAVLMVFLDMAIDIRTIIAVLRITYNSDQQRTNAGNRRVE